METSSPAASSKADVPTFSGAVGFTPGPWRVGCSNTGHPDRIGVHAREWIVADVWQDVEELGDYAKPNAHLIAAAPALYEALAEAVADYERHHASVDDAPVWVIGARAALKQARGE